MSGITGISTAALQAPPSTVAAAATVTATAQPQTARSDAATPAVVVSLSNAATVSAATASSAPRSMDPTAVEDALSRVSGANGQTTLYDHVDRTLEEAKFGTAISVRNQAELVGAVVGEATAAISSAESLGIQVHDPVSPEAISNGAKPEYITVAPFSFTNGGSTYAIKPGANGTLVGTKDGQAWQTWQIIPTGQPGTGPSITPADTGAATALQTLTALNAQKTPAADTASAGKSALPLNILS